MVGSLRFFRAVVVVGLGLAVSEASSLERVVIGGDGHFDWRSKGTGPVSTIAAGYRSLLDPNKLLVGNAPGELIDFNNTAFNNALLLLQIQEGENIANGTVKRGGNIDAPNIFDFGRLGASSQASTTIFDANDLRVALEELIIADDGGEKKAFERKFGNGLGTLIILNLGGRFGVDRIRFYPRNTAQPSPTTPFENDYIRAFELFINDGLSLTEAGNPIWEPLVVETDNEDPVVEIVLDPPRTVQSMRLRSISNVNFEIDEIELFGKGFLSAGQYVSDIYDAGRPAIWGKLRWNEQVLGDSTFSGLRIRTRTGSDPAPFVFTRVLAGKRDADEVAMSITNPQEEMGLEEYQSLPQNDGQNRQWNPGAVRDDLVNWSPFSTPYASTVANDPTGIAISSPSPRRYFQFQVNFESSDLNASRVLEALSFDVLAPPLADELIGEIYPRQVDIGETTDFTFAVRYVAHGTGSLGFDRIRIETPTRVESIESIAILDSEGQIVAERDFMDYTDTTTVAGFRPLALDNESFTISLPLVQQTQSVVKVNFKTSVLTYSSDFRASVELSKEPDIAQQAFAGNAALLGDDDDPDLSNTTVLSPSLLTQEGLLDRVELQPSSFTPNGDGINDHTTIRYNLLSVSNPRPVSIRVYNLSGQLIREVHDSPELTGQYVDKHWNGRDDLGHLMPPGLYIVRIEVRGDSQQDSRTLLAGLAY